MSDISAGADHLTGSVSRREGCRDGREVPPPVVGGLADSGPCPAQPGRGGPGEYSWEHTPDENTLEYSALCNRIVNKYEY